MEYYHRHVVSAKSGSNKKYRNSIRRSSVPVAAILALLGVLVFLNHFVLRPISDRTLLDLDNNHYATQLSNLSEQTIPQFRFARSHAYRKRGLLQKAAKACNYLCGFFRSSEPANDTQRLVFNIDQDSPPPISESVITPDMVNRLVMSLYRMRQEEHVVAYMEELDNLRIINFRVYWATVEWLIRSIDTYDGLSPVLGLLWLRLAKEVLEIMRQANALQVEGLPANVAPQTLVDKLITPQVQEGLIRWVSRVRTEEDVKDVIKKNNEIRHKSGDWYWAISEWMYGLYQQNRDENTPPWNQIPLELLSHYLLHDMMINMPTLAIVRVPSELLPSSPTRIMGADINVDPSAVRVDNLSPPQTETLPLITVDNVPADDIMNLVNPVTPSNSGGINALFFDNLSNSPPPDESTKKSEGLVTFARDKRDFKIRDTRESDRVRGDTSSIDNSGDKANNDGSVRSDNVMGFFSFNYPSDLNSRGVYPLF